MAIKNLTLDTPPNYYHATSIGSLGLTKTTHLTMGCWFQRASTNARGLCGLYTSGYGGRGIRVNHGGPGEVSAIQSNNGFSSQQAPASGTIAVDTYGLALAEFPDENSRSCWLDNGTVGTNSTTVNLSTTGDPTRIIIGTDFDGLCGRFTIAWFILWSGALTGTHRTELMSYYPNYVNVANIIECIEFVGNDPELGINGTSFAKVGTLSTVAGPSLSAPGGPSFPVKRIMLF